MDKKLTKNYIYSVLYQLLIVVMPFITTPYLTRVMGAETLSINTVTGNLVQWFVLFGIMGVNIYGNREIARVRDNKEDLSRTFFEIFAMQFMSMCISSIVFFIYCFASHYTYQNILLIQGITLLSVSLDITWFFYGVEDFKKASIRNMLVKIIGVALIFLLVKSPADLITFVLINTCVGVGGQLIMWAQLKQYIEPIKITLKGVMKHFKPNIALFIPQIAISVYSVLDITMLGFMGPRFSDTNLYEQAQKFVKMFLFFITSIGSVMLPRVSNVHSKGDTEGVKRYLGKTLRLALYMAIPMIFGICGMIQNFVDWFLPADYQAVGFMIQCTSPIILFISLSNVYGTQYMVPTGDVKHYTWSVVSGALINFCVNFTLIPSLGAYGAIIGSVSAEAAVTLIQKFFIRKEIKFDIQLSELVIIIVSSIIMYFPTHYVGVWLGANFFVNILQVIAGVLTYAICLFIFRPPFFKEMIQSFKQRGFKHEG